MYVNLHLIEGPSSILAQESKHVTNKDHQRINDTLVFSIFFKLTPCLFVIYLVLSHSCPVIFYKNIME